MSKLLATLITLAAAGGGITAWYTLIHPSPPSCGIAGSVYTNTDYKPIPDVSVEYVGDDGKYLHAATTGPDGSFRFNCSNIKSFPLKLRFTRRDWSAAASVVDGVDRNEEALNFYVEGMQGAPPTVSVGPPPGRRFDTNKNGVIVGPPPSLGNRNRSGVIVPPPPSRPR